MIFVGGAVILAVTTAGVLALLALEVWHWRRDAGVVFALVVSLIYSWVAYEFVNVILVAVENHPD